MPLPAISLVAVPGRRRLTIELAQEIERRGFAGIYSPSMFGNMSLCEAWRGTPRPSSSAPPSPRSMPAPWATSRKAAPSCTRFPAAASAWESASHTAQSHVRMGVTPGKPLGDTRNFVERFRAQEGLGPLPPIIIAALRKKMVALAGEISQGVVFANASLSHMADSLSALPEAKRNDPDFFIGNMLPTCISDDVEAAKAVNRRSLTNYAFLPNYRNYWKEAGYVEEMTAIEQAIADGRRDDVTKYFTDKWLADNTVFGPAARVREGIEAWQAAGVRTPVIVPSSAAGNQLKAFEEIFAAFA